MRGGADVATRARCVVLGGTTIRDAEIKFGMAVTGIIHPDRIVTNRGAKEGIALALTKPLGTGFVTTAHKKNRCPPGIFQAAVASMTQLNYTACAAMKAAGAQGATDVTGFGLAGHGFEMAKGSGKTLLILFPPSLPRIPGIETLIAKGFFTRASRTNRGFVESSLRWEGSPTRVDQELFFDAQTSGGLLIAAGAKQAEDLLEPYAPRASPRRRSSAKFVSFLQPLSSPGAKT